MRKKAENVIVWPNQALLKAAQAVVIEELAVGEVELQPGIEMPEAAATIARECSEYLKDEQNQPYNEFYEKVLRVMMGDRDGRIGLSR